MDEIKIHDVLNERDVQHAEKQKAGKRLAEIKSELYAVDDALSRLREDAKFEALLLPKELVSNSDKLKIQTEHLLNKMNGVAEKQASKMTLEQQKLMCEFDIYKAKDALELLSNKVAVWEIQQKRIIAETEERRAQKDFDTQRLRIQN